MSCGPVLARKTSSLQVHQGEYCTVVGGLDCGKCGEICMFIAPVQARVWKAQFPRPSTRAGRGRWGSRRSPRLVLHRAGREVPEDRSATRGQEDGRPAIQGHHGTAAAAAGGGSGRVTGARPSFRRRGPRTVLRSQEEKGAAHSPWRSLHLSESGRRSSRSRTNHRGRCSVAPTTTVASTTVATRRRPPRRVPPARQRPPAPAQAAGAGRWSLSASAPSARPTVTCVGRAAGPA